MISSYEQRKITILSSLPIEFHDVFEDLAWIMLRPGEGEEAKLKNLFLLQQNLGTVINEFALSQYLLGYDSGYAAGEGDTE